MRQEFLFDVLTKRSKPSMRLFYFPVVILFLFSFYVSADSFTGVTVTDSAETEANFKDKSLSNEFCCDREQVSDFSQDISQQESRIIVNKVLYSGFNEVAPINKPSSGQR